MNSRITPSRVLALAGAPGDFFGYSVASAGDVNGDGFADLIVGAYADDVGGTDAGRAYVYYGGPGADAVADLTLTGSATDHYFGISVSSAGDVNGDGYGDLIVGAPGRAYVYYGGPSPDAIADVVLTGAAPGDLFGWPVSSAGDVNGDGFDDLIVGAALAGRAYVYYGGPNPDSLPDLTLTGSLRFGSSVASAGDVNGDGYSDVIVGSPWAESAYVYYGGPSADASADLTFTGAAADFMFGFPVATAGDVNGDGFADVIVGASGNNVGGFSAGRAYVYYGGPGADAIADLTMTGSECEGFGWSVASAGDVNRDGFADVIVGAPWIQWGDSDICLNSPHPGRAYIFYGGRRADANADITLMGVGAYFSNFGRSVAAAGDINGDRFGDVIVGEPDSAFVYEMRRKVRVDRGGEHRTSSVAPNPFNPSGVLAFTTERPGRVRVRMFDLHGRLVRTLMETPLLPAGEHEVRIDGWGERGEVLPSGVYFYQVDSPGGTVTGHFAILK